MIYCPSCGTGLPAQANFCISCGVPVEKSDSENVMTDINAPMRQQRFFRILFAALILCLIIGGFVTKTMGTRLGKKGQIEPHQLITTGIRGKIIQSSTLGDLLIITGNVQNKHPDTQNSITLICNLFDQKGSVSRTIPFYAGNIIPETELVTMDENTIKETMQNRFGKDGLNANVQPGQMIPFMVVCFNMDSNLAEFSIEPTGSIKGIAQPAAADHDIIKGP